MGMGNKIYTSDQLYEGKTIEKYINVFSMVVTDQMELTHSHTHTHSHIFLEDELCDWHHQHKWTISHHYKWISNPKWLNCTKSEYWIWGMKRVREIFFFFFHSFVMYVTQWQNMNRKKCKVIHENLEWVDKNKLHCIGRMKLWWCKMEEWRTANIWTLTSFFKRTLRIQMQRRF